MVSECGHTEMERYTPNTVIQWTEGECHVMLASTDSTIEMEDNASKTCDESVTNDTKTESETIKINSDILDY